MNYFGVGEKKIAYTYFSMFAAVFIVLVIHLTGGFPSVYGNPLYLIITLTAVKNGKNHSVVVAGFCALLIIPVQIIHEGDPIRFTMFLFWAMRFASYMIIALVIGWHADHLREKLRECAIKDAEIEKEQLSLIESLVTISESRDDDTGKHMSRIAIYSQLIAQHLSTTEKYADYIDDKYIYNLGVASQLHDIGKIGIPDNILLKKGNLTAAEFEVIKTHTTLGVDIIKTVMSTHPDNQYARFAQSLTLHHHERWDGTGYPMGLVGEDIPLTARIVALADVYDALRSKRVYKDEYAKEDCLHIIAVQSGRQFDPDIIDAFIAHEDRFDEIYNDNI